jgi:CRISPR-associated protein Csd1
MTKVVQLHRDFICTGRIEDALDDKRIYPQIVSLLHSRMAILKAYFIRKGDNNMSHSLNKEYPHPAYHCGRLMYVLARLQKEALPDVKAGVVQRFYAAASSRPAMVIGQLITKSKYHLASLGKEKEGFAIWFENTIKEIMDAIKAKGEKDIPSTLTLEEQSLFALGYYHQMAYRENNDKNTATQTKENTNE